MQAYLQTDPKYANLFKNVWLWNDFCGRTDLGGGDTGIDLVALTFQGDFWAIQCKCFQEESSIDKPAVDSFLSTSSREFKDEGMKTARFSHRLWISTTNKWGSNAEEAIKNQNPPVTRLNLYDLQEAPVDWTKLDKGITGEESRTAKKKIRPHQQEALEKTHEYFKTADRGKLIMACGTGKTFNTLRIAEHETNGKGLILFLVPSISLLGQTLREWYANAEEPINAVCICSDPEVSRKKSKNDDSDSSSVVDLALPASTNVKEILNQFRSFDGKKGKGLTVVFSTYQSIEVIAKAQKKLHEINKRYSEFDLIICDEAHRTTGVALAGVEESAFIKVHDNKFIRGKKRLYMTATPRLYSDDAKGKAAQADAVLCSMDDEKLYGEEIYRIGFGEAVERDLLTDYKVLILTLSDKDVPPAVQDMISDRNSEINTDDASKLIGCINALSKQILGDEGIIKATDPEPMRRAVAFCQKIVASKQITSTFNTATDAYISSLPSAKKEQMVSVASQHIDGTMSAPERDELLSWLKSRGDENECRILTNVRCLSEGVDVPSLDAVMFLSARNSQVDVVQSVGRVMRKAPGKKYGYIIIPVVVPSEIEADKALDDNERYKVVWTVLNALRAHDDRFNATVNKLELNRKKPEQILVGRPEYSFEDGQPVSTVAEDGKDKYGSIGEQLALQFEQLQGVVFARMVQKVGDRRYWEQWARNVAEIAERQVERITRLIKEEGKHRKAFDKFLIGLQKNINPSISEREAIEMLSQHIITKPVFEALFERYSFVQNNAISQSMQKMLATLESANIAADDDNLNKFYEFVKLNIGDLDNAEAKQSIIVRLYDSFFKIAFPKMVEKLGIVYTPIEVVDFIIRSVADVLKKEFGRNIGDENIHILDPFTGTGTFITRLLQSGLIGNADLRRKYREEIHANEIVLLAYYIAAVNIENAFHDVVSAEEFMPFEGICLTDTFQLGETDENESFLSDIFPQNSKRVLSQKRAPLRVIFGNPPYSIGQKNANDNAQNQSYSKLEKNISETYATASSGTLSKSLYDAYIKAFRWSTDRLDPANGGIIAYVSNGNWLTKNSMDGFRKTITKEFSKIYVFDLKGAIRGKSGELAKREGKNIFNILTGVSITILVKKPGAKQKDALIFYQSVGDYLSRDEKIGIIREFSSISNPTIKWIPIKPNEHGDWLDPRNESYSSYVPLAPANKFDIASQSFFTTYAIGVSTNRDAWVYNFNRKKILKNMSSFIDFYNDQCSSFQDAVRKNPKLTVELHIDSNPKRISWTRSLRNDLKKGIEHKLCTKSMTFSIYRPFCMQFLLYDRPFIESPGLSQKFFPHSGIENRLIVVTGTGARQDFSTIITNDIASLDTLEKAQCFPLYFYEEREKQNPSLFDADGDCDFIQREAITDFIHERAKKIYGKNVAKEDIFFYVYGLLHSTAYREAFAADLKKTLPRLPLVDEPRDFWKFSKAGRELADLHINYESVPPYGGVKIRGESSGYFKVEKMKFPKKDQKDTIIYNNKISIEHIPEKAYEYVVNGKSAIEWVMERYQITTHKASGIVNDPNDWAEEVGNPRYILDLLLSIINVSLKTMKIVENLPQVKFE
jgi:predicted helicase